MKKIGMIGVICLSLSGCGVAGVNGTIHDRSDDYLKARLVEPLKYPKVLPTVPQKFTIPAGERAAEPVSTKPPGVF